MQNNNETNEAKVEERNKFDIKLENFDGPLDLLLSLVQEKNVDIMDVDVSELASAYLNIIQELQDNEVDIASDYLVMAASLLALKAKMLLYTQEEKPEIEEDKREILRRLYEYQQIKEVSSVLREQEKLRKDIFIKQASNIDEFLVEDNNTELTGNSNPLRLITILRKMFERTFAQNLRRAKFEAFNLTPKDQIPFIMNLFDSNDDVTFEMIFNLPSINHFVITLLAILDLARRQIILIHQEEQYGRITFKKGPLYEK